MNAIIFPNGNQGCLIFMNENSKSLVACYLLIRGHHKDSLEIIQSINFEKISDYSFDELCKHITYLNYPFLKHLENKYKKIKDEYKSDGIIIKKIAEGKEVVDVKLQGDYTEIRELINFYFQRALKG